MFKLIIFMTLFHGPVGPNAQLEFKDPAMSSNQYATQSRCELDAAEARALMLRKKNVNINTLCVEQDGFK